MFIHTFELSMFIGYGTYLLLKDELPNARMCGGKKEKYLVYDSSYNDNGIAIAMRKTSEKEWKYSEAKEDILILYVNISKLYVPGDEKNHIDNEEKFREAMEKLDAKIKEIFSATCMKGIEMKNFFVSRVDITKDATLSEDAIPLLLSCVRRLDLQYGFSHNKELEKNTPEFDCNKSVNIISKSRGYEFVFYNKCQAMLEKNYVTEELVECYRNILRIELRCRRKFVSRIVEGSAFETMLLFYKVKDKIFYHEYKSLFVTSTSEDFVSLACACQQIYLIDWTKEKKRNQAENLIKFLAKNEEYSPVEACIHLFCKESTGKTVLRHLQQLGFSPITIPKNKKEIIRIPALDKVVGLEMEVD